MTELVNIPGIKELIVKYELTTLVETGCYKGGGIQQALGMRFKTIYSCDINSNWVGYSSKRFHSYENVYISELSSTDFLTSILHQEVKSNILFWLDAHFPVWCGAHMEEEGDLRYPLATELSIIKHNADESSCVVACDDMRVLSDYDGLGKAPSELLISGITIQDLVDIMYPVYDGYLAKTFEDDILIFEPVPCVNG